MMQYRMKLKLCIIEFNDAKPKYTRLSNKKFLSHKKQKPLDLTDE